LSHAKFLPNRT